MWWFLGALFFALLPACGRTTSADAGARDSEADVGLSDAAPFDGAAMDGSLTDASDGSTDAEPCTGPCATVDLTATFGAVTETFDRVQFGFTNSGGARALYLEAHGGGSPDCPSMTSPSPDRTVVMNGLPLLAEEPFTDFTANLLDFEGTLSALPISASTSATYITLATSLTPLDGAFVAFELTATYEGGSIRGHGYATYCESLSDP